jgi:glycosyltransferase involved in cell wall biosynthesis
MKKLAIISSHPIQYNAPLFALIAKEDDIELKVFYTWGESCLVGKFDPDFGKIIDWDIPLLEGYDFHFPRNTATNPGSHHFRGIINPDLIQNIESWGADVVWVWGWAFYSHLKIIRHFHRKIPVWFRGDSTLLDEPKSFLIKRIARRFFLRWVYKHVDKAFYVGTNNKNYFKAHGLKENQLVFAPHAIDNERFLDLSGEKLKKAYEWRTSLGIKENDFVLLFAGKLELKKNPLFLLEIAKVIKDIDFKILIVGNGILESLLKEHCINDSRFIFLEFQNQSVMPIVYRVANLFILPSLGPGETWGIALNEALACGIPVLATNNCGGACDLINDNNGFVINQRIDNQEIIKCINWSKSLESNIIQREFVSTFNYNTIIKEINNNFKKY